MTKPFLLGILGGMGPLATVDVMHKLIAATPAVIDQQHLPMVVWNVPQIADRQRALAGQGPSPLPQLLHGIRQLNQAGASHIVIACNTAHHWYADLAAHSRAPILHIADVTVDAIAAAEAPPHTVGIIATAGTLNAGWFQRRLTARGIGAALPTKEEIERWFVPGCYAVKRGALAEGGRLLEQQARALLERGAEPLILACTEVPMGLRAIDSPLNARAIDPAASLAAACVALWRTHCPQR